MRRAAATTARCIAALACMWGGASCGNLLPPLDGGTAGSSGTVVSTTGTTRSTSTTTSVDGTTSTTSGASGSTSEGGSTTTGPDLDSSSDSTGIDEGLIDNGVIVRYFMDERVTMMPVDVDMVLDAITPPLDLVIGYSPLWTQPIHESIDPSAVIWFEPGAAGRLFNNVDTKVINALNNTKTITIEVVAAIHSLPSNSAQVGGLVEINDVITFGASGAGGIVVIVHTDQGTFTMDWGNSEVRAVERSVYHVVIDSNNPDDNLRAQLFINGVSQGVHGGGKIGLDAVVTVNGAKELVLGNRVTNNLSFGGNLYYAAIYGKAMTEAEVTHQSALLEVNDDTQP